jgi:methylglutaconyl-CoA hydratase
MACLECNQGEMNDYKTLLISEEPYQLTIWLNRPEVHNALNEELIAELTDVFNHLERFTELRTVVIRGKGKSFCSGADLNYMKGIAGFGFEENVKDGRKLAELYQSIYNCNLPTIAMVHGSAFGGANGLLAACDIVIAEKNTTFAFSEVKLGIIPATISPFVIKRIGEFAAKEMMMTGRRFKADEAERIHLANHCIAESDFDKYLDKTVREFFTSAPKAVKKTKELINHIIDKELDEVIDYTVNKIAEMRASEEGQEGMAAFLEKRKPDWIK